MATALRASPRPRSPRMPSQPRAPLRGRSSRAPTRRHRCRRPMATATARHRSLRLPQWVSVQRRRRRPRRPRRPCRPLPLPRFRAASIRARGCDEPPRRRRSLPSSQRRLLLRRRRCSSLLARWRGCGRRRSRRRRSVIPRRRRTATVRWRSLQLRRPAWITPNRLRPYRWRTPPTAVATATRATPPRSRTTCLPSLRPRGSSSRRCSQPPLPSRRMHINLSLPMPKLQAMRHRWRPPRRKQTMRRRRPRTRSPARRSFRAIRAPSALEPIKAVG